MPLHSQVEEPEYPEPTTVEKLKKLPYGVGYEATTYVFAQLTFFGSLFVLFLNKLAFSKSQIGLILSLTPFLVILSLISQPITDRLGAKRAFVGIWGIRNSFAIGLLFVPWVLASYGVQGAFIFLIIITGCFATLRGVSLLAYLPWQQEFTPEHIRGKFFAYINIFNAVAGLFAIGLSGYVLNRTTKLDGYMILFAVGQVFALISLGLAIQIPGGAPRPQKTKRVSQLSRLKGPLSDHGFMLFLAANALFTLATGPLISFTPLYMQEKIGLSAGNVIYLGIGALLGGILTGFFWGWAADRYGSQPVIVFGLLFKTFYPLLLILTPRNQPFSLAVALGIYFVGGFADMGWVIGSSRLLFGRLVPRSRALDYSAVYYAWLGLVSGCGALLGGWVLERYIGFQGQLFGFTLDAYTLLFIAAGLFPLAAVLIVMRVQSDSVVSIGEFAGLFYHGNPLLAMESLFRFHRAGNEPATISLTERLGRSHSPLTVEELLEALDDPRFLVRFEALVAIGRLAPNERLRTALTKVLHGKDPAMSVMAAWTLGRTRDRLAIEPLRQALDSHYRSVRAHAARSLAGLDDVESLPLLVAQFESESDFGLRVAYSASLAKLGDERVIPEVLALLEVANDQVVRSEMALSLARLIGDEKTYISLLRGIRQGAGTTLAQASETLLRKSRSLPLAPETFAQADRFIEAFARDELDQGVLDLLAFAGDLPQDRIPEPFHQLLVECIRQAKLHKSARLEYPILIIHLLRVRL